MGLQSVWVKETETVWTWQIGWRATAHMHSRPEAKDTVRYL